mgnify:CR=1 FL=1
MELGFEAGVMAIPLFQTSFLPNLIQVNFNPEIIEAEPSLEHEVPAFVAPKAGLKLTHKTIRVRNE